MHVGAIISCVELLTVHVQVSLPLSPSAYLTPMQSAHVLRIHDGANAWDTTTVGRSRRRGVRMCIVE